MSVTPNHFAVLPQNSNKTFNEEMAASLIKTNGYLQVISVEVQNGDYRKPHICYFYQIKSPQKI